MLQLKNITYKVLDEDNGVEKIILDNVSLDINDDSFVVITGPNGSGKSTLAKLIMGIIQPSKGQIIFNGKDITGLDITERARLGVGFAFQQPVKFKGLLVKDLLSLAAGKELSVNETCAYLAEVGLCANDYVERELNSSLSGGELKRIEIAMLMTRGVKLSLFDEPEAGIDLWSFHNLIRVFTNLRAHNQGSIVIISHQERILEIADKVVVMSAGKIIGEGDKETMLPYLLAETAPCKFYREEYK